MATLDSMRAPQVLNNDQARTLLRQMADKFKFQHSVADWMVDKGMRSLQDFQQIVTSQEEVETKIIDMMPRGTQWVDCKMVQTTRMRIAWVSTFQAQLGGEKKQSSAESGQDVLPLTASRALEQRWFMCYGSTPEAGMCPSDWSVTGAARQLRSRRIVQPNLLQLKSL